MKRGKNVSAVKDDTVGEIAFHLVKNHLRAFSEPSEWHHFVKSETLKDLVERRVVAVVGAGASKPAGLPLAAEAQEMLKRESEMPSRALDAELDRLTLIYNLEKDTLETYLRALSTSAFEAQKLRNNLQTTYGHRFMPMLGYEILAHMLKHRFLDAIINFNFDELLDQSIEDEFDRGEYHHILSDGDCPDNSELRDTRPELPFYIKPHGTASHKSTLRFTREDYYGLPYDIQRILRYLLTERPIVLLVIGFDMQSLELNRILEEARPESMMFHINLINPTAKITIEKPKEIEKFSSNKLLKVDGKHHNVSEALKDIWNYTSDAFRPEYRPRDITRHVLISEIFFRDINESNIESYLKGRTVIELCLSIAKGKGLVTMSHLSQDRSGKYFDLYKGIKPDANFYEMCRNVGLRDVGYSREAMRLMREEEMISEILNKNEFENEIGFLYGRVRNNLDHTSQNRLKPELFRDTLIGLYDGLEVELRYRPYNPYTKIFHDPKPIFAYTAMRFHTKQMFRQEWQYLFVVAETGQWLVDEFFSEVILNNANAKIYLIVADRSWDKEVRNKYGRRIVDIRELPWWEHNRHVTILANKNRTPLGSIYFSRRLRNANITPLFLDNVDDTLAVLESFNAYWIKASRIKEPWITASASKDFKNLFEYKKPKKKK